MAKSDLYFSVDIETDGPIPGRNSMLSLGCAAMYPHGEICATWEANFETLEGASPDPKTMAWWETQPEAWEACRKNLQDVRSAMWLFSSWVKITAGTTYKPVCVAYPAGFDFMFLYWYLIEFVGQSPFSFSCVDMKSYAFAKLGGSFREASKRNFPKEWFDPEVPHTHVALDDAIEQGRMFCKMLRHGTDGD